ncbi:hypothetical protein LIA77_07489 [Sarocladium implicatum]|nr:hypothetical protein LIA77_07489 [Sarocladium implicatum]
MEFKRSNTLKRRRSEDPSSDDTMTKRLHALPSPCSSTSSFPNTSKEAQQGCHAPMVALGDENIMSVDDEKDIDEAMPAIRDAGNTGNESPSVFRSGGLLFPKPGQTPIEFIVTRPDVMEFTGGNAEPRSGMVIEEVSTPATLRTLPTPPESPLTLGRFLDDIRQARQALKKEAAEDGEDLSDDSGDDSDVSRLSMRLQPLTLDEIEAENDLHKNLEAALDEIEAENELYKELEATLDEIEAEQEAKDDGYAADLED